jgi:hypothetical protein
MKLNGWSVPVLCAVMLAFAFSADAAPASKVTASVGYINVLDELSVSTNSSASTTGAWHTVLRNTLKTPNQQDLFVGVSLEVGLLLDTATRKRSDVASASAGVEVRVLIDGQEANPRKVTFSRRSQVLRSSLQDIIDGCLALDTNTMSIVVDTNCVQESEMSLISDTMTANTFNFIATDLSAGSHQIQVQARINLGTAAVARSARARALIGNGSMTVESVRLAHDEDIEIP